MPDCTIYNASGEKIAVFSTENFGSTILIGRATHCDVCLKGQVNTTISREHLKLEKSALGWSITNLSKHAHLFKNCEKVDRAPLADGDIFRFTDLFFGFGPAAKPSRFDLTWEAFTEDGRKHAVLWPGLNSIGSSRDNYVTIRAESVSRVHGYIRISGNNATLRGNAMENSTSLNQLDVGVGEVAIQPNDLITFGDVDVHFIEGFRMAANLAAIHLTASSEGSKQSKRESRRNKSLIAIVIILMIAVIAFIVYLFVKLSK